MAPPFDEETVAIFCLVFFQLLAWSIVPSAVE
jgi:hypothetical protein